MPRIAILSATDQVTAYLRDELSRGTWSGLMPGGDRLATELGIGRDTVEVALQRLEKDGLLINQGRRRGRLIVQPAGVQAAAQLRVAILVSESADLALHYIIDLQHKLVQAGHAAFFVTQTMSGLGKSVKSIARMVRATDADAWVVIGGARDVLEWFEMQDTPIFALFGRRRGLVIAAVGPDKRPALIECIQKLAGLGHRRIVLLTREGRRVPTPGRFEQAFLEELAVQGLGVGSYNLPSWIETVEGLHACLEGLFQVTPPTALIADEAPFFNAVLQFCANRGFRVPHDVSLVCTDADTIFDWYQPSVAHIQWDSRPVVRRIVNWATNLSRGKMDVRQTLTTAEFVTGGTIGLARKG